LVEGGIVRLIPFVDGGPSRYLPFGDGAFSHPPHSALLPRSQPENTVIIRWRRSIEFGLHVRTGSARRSQTPPFDDGYGAHFHPSLRDTVTFSLLLSFHWALAEFGSDFIMPDQTPLGADQFSSRP
jgi:hypothetical protein